MMRPIILLQIRLFVKAFGKSRYFFAFFLRFAQNLPFRFEMKHPVLLIEILVSVFATTADWCVLSIPSHRSISKNCHFCKNYG